MRKMISPTKIAGNSQTKQFRVQKSATVTTRIIDGVIMIKCKIKRYFLAKPQIALFLEK